MTDELKEQMVSIGIGVLAAVSGILAAVGIPIAVQISWGLARSIPWAAWHGLCGWFYILYRWLIVGVY